MKERKKVLPVSQKIILKAEKTVLSLVNLINKSLPLSNFIAFEKAAKQDEKVSVVCESGNCWYMGYNSLSIIPEDIYTKKYYIGGNISIPPRKINDVINDIKVRSVCLSVNSNGKKIVLASVDCIGLSNFYVKKIREDLHEFCKKNNIASINVFATHTHSSIDTMGIWSVTTRKIFSNIINLHKKSPVKPSVDMDYMSFLVKKIEESIIFSFYDLSPGEMFVQKIGINSAEELRDKIYKKIGFNKETTDWNKSWEKQWRQQFLRIPICESGIYEYILAKRNPYEFSPCITKIRFKPFDDNRNETIIINLSAHPYSDGLKIRKLWDGNCLSGDFPHHMENIFNKNKYNFLFVNGAINGIYPQRGATQVGDGVLKTRNDEQTEIIGSDFARIAMAAGQSKDKIFSNPITNPVGKSNVYQSITLRNFDVKEIKIEPTLIECKKSIFFHCSNPLEQIIGKLNFSQFNIYKSSSNKIFIKSELGFLQIGDFVKIAFIPGELSPELLTGRGTKTGNIINKECKSFKCLNDIFDDNTIVFGLANDSIGYIIPDNDYCMFYIGNGEFSKKLLGKNYTHYQELFSLGSETASKIMTEMELLKFEMDKYFQKRDN